MVEPDPGYPSEPLARSSCRSFPGLAILPEAQYAVGTSRVWRRAEANSGGRYGHQPRAARDRGLGIACVPDRRPASGHECRRAPDHALLPCRDRDDDRRGRTGYADGGGSGDRPRGDDGHLAARDHRGGGAPTGRVPRPRAGDHPSIRAHPAPASGKGPEAGAATESTSSPGTSTTPEARETTQASATPEARLAAQAPQATPTAEARQTKATKATSARTTAEAAETTKAPQATATAATTQQTQAAKAACTTAEAAETTQVAEAPGAAHVAQRMTLFGCDMNLAAHQTRSTGTRAATSCLLRAAELRLRTGRSW